VATVAEGVQLREAGITAPIMLLSEPPTGDVPAVVEWDLTPTAYTMNLLRALGTAGSAGPVSVQLKVDTGMHRVGASPEAAVELARHIVADDRLQLEGVWTHFSVADEDAEYTQLQNTRFARVLDALIAAGISPGVRHAANTAGAIEHPEARWDMVRVGLGMYGMRPAPNIGTAVPLIPAMRVVSHVAYVRRHPAGTRPSYGRRRPLDQEATVATVPIGYADGVARRLSSVGGEVLIGGRRRPFAGTVTMDQIVVDVDNDEVDVGDEVVLLGRQGDMVISAEEWAVRLDTINYEIVCGFGPRVPRRYRRGPAE
jgi:alanine racemase